MNREFDEIDREAERLFGKQKRDNRQLRYRRAMEQDAGTQWEEALKRERDRVSDN
jgi:hypothetical protein